MEIKNPPTPRLKIRVRIIIRHIRTSLGDGKHLSNLITEQALLFLSHHTSLKLNRQSFDVFGDTAGLGFPRENLQDASSSGICGRDPSSDLGVNRRSYLRLNEFT